jgi:hypothetical protein
LSSSLGVYSIGAETRGSTGLDFGLGTVWRSWNASAIKPLGTLAALGIMPICGSARAWRVNSNGTASEQPKPPPEAALAALAIGLAPSVTRYQTSESQQ